MSKNTLEFVQENGNYYLSKEGLYIQMYGGSRAPSLLPRYATDYVVHKEVMRQLYIDGVENFLFDQKKVVHPPLPFYTGNYRFTKVKIHLSFLMNLNSFILGKKVSIEMIR